MKSLMQLLQHVLADASDGCCTSTTRDFETISRRVEHEGLSFLTITLPEFAKGFEKSLERGQVASVDFQGFHFPGGLSLPAFMQGLMKLVFDSKTGRLLPEPDITAIFYIRQVSLIYKKLLIECAEKRTRAAYATFKECEDDITKNQAAYFGPLVPHQSLPDHYRDFGYMADVLWSGTLAAVTSQLQELFHVPKHGPGATAERISGNRKYDIQRWHRRLDPFFPVDGFAVVNAKQLLDRGYKGFDVIESGAEEPVRVISVPKTLKTPRIIAIEPVCMQYTQQSVKEILVAALEQHPLTAGSVNFTDQTINQGLALAESKRRRLATLDLSEASDRVSNQLVLRMLKTVPDLSGAVQACRSLTADLPGHGIMPLSKFASMGSALCFPIEAMVFYTICLVGVARARSLRFSQQTIKSLKREVYVYGDDLIVPVDCVLSVIESLEALGLKVNTKKSFWKSHFRESCGMDAYDGHRITPVYCRKVLTNDRRDGSLVSWVALSNNLHTAGLWKAAQYCKEQVEFILGKLPIVSDQSPALGWRSFQDGGLTTGRWNKNLHRHEVRAYTWSTTPKTSRVDGYGALMKFFLKRSGGRTLLSILGVNVPEDKQHLERSGRSSVGNIKLRWVPVL